MQTDDRIKVRTCHHCDFGSGMRGMDRCSKCDGTGSQLHTPSGKLYPNTKKGHDAAMAEIIT